MKVGLIMMITVEGPSCSGKSTLANALHSILPDSVILRRPEVQQKRSSYHVIEFPNITFEELRQVAPNGGEDQLLLQLKFAHLVTKRLKQIKKQLKKNPPWLIADRDITSFIAHGYARLFTSTARDRLLFKELVKYVWAQNPIIPDLYIYLKTPRKICIERAWIRSSMLKDQSRIPKEYIFDPIYFNLISESYQHMADSRGRMRSIVLDGNLNTELLVEQTLCALKELDNLETIDPQRLINHVLHKY